MSNVNQQLKDLSKQLSGKSKRQVSVQACDMPNSMMSKVVATFNDAMDETLVESKIAEKMQTKFQESFPTGAWHAIVGRDFGSYVSHEEGHFIYMSLGMVSLLLFMSKD